MNCKPGDLAVVVKSFAGNLGRIVRCIRLRSEAATVRRPDGSFVTDAIWEIDTCLPDFSGTQGPFCQDSLLRPIRDPGDDAIDESLQWLRVPEVDTV